MRYFVLMLPGTCFSWPRCAYAFLVLINLHTSHAVAASFDCSKAQSRAEKAICADAELSTLDEHLGQYYFAAREELTAAANCLKDDQQQWLRRVRNACSTNECLKRAYLDRLSELHPLQPGATAITYRELPRRPGLVWIIPPAQDEVAAPPNPHAEAFQAVGSVVNEVADGDGYTLRTKGGDSYLLLPLMFIDGRSADVLPQLAKEKSSVFMARGYAAKDDAGKISFEPSRCLYLYRLPPD